MQQFLVKSCLISTIIALTGCAGPGQMFEPSMYGVRQSLWVTMSDGQKQQAIIAYQKEQERLAEEARLRAIREAHETKINNMAETTYSRYEKYGQNNNYYFNNYEYNQLSSSDKTVYQQKINALKASREHQEQLSRQKEQRDIDEAKRRSLETHRQEQASRQQYEQIRQQREQRDIDEAKRRSLETYRQEQAARQQVQSGSATTATTAPTSSDWQPNEGQLVNGGQLVMQLQRDMGQRPSATQMNNHLQSNMGLSSSQAQKIIDELGLY